MDAIERWSLLQGLSSFCLLRSGELNEWSSLLEIGLHSVDLVARSIDCCRLISTKGRLSPLPWSFPIISRATNCSLTSSVFVSKVSIYQSHARSYLPIKQPLDRIKCDLQLPSIPYFTNQTHRYLLVPLFQSDKNAYPEDTRPSLHRDPIRARRSKQHQLATPYREQSPSPKRDLRTNQPRTEGYVDTWWSISTSHQNDHSLTTFTPTDQTYCINDRLQNCGKDLNGNLRVKSADCARAVRKIDPNRRYIRFDEFVQSSLHHLILSVVHIRPLLILYVTQGRALPRSRRVRGLVHPVR